MPLPYLLHVTSRPKPESGVDDKLWEKWYTTEHLPDLVTSGTTKRAIFYRETFDFAAASKEPPAHKYLAIYQTDFEDALSTNEFATKVRHGSDMFPTKKETVDNGDFDVRNYKLFQDYDPNSRGDAAPPFMLTVEMMPGDEADFEKWVREEHFDMLSKMPGYRRSTRYVLGPKATFSVSEPNKYLTLHEVDNLRAFDGEEAQAASSTPWSIKHLTECKSIIVRGWEKLHSEGY